MLRVLIRYVKFMGTSVIGTVVDTLVLWLLSDFIFTEGYWGEYVISPVISFHRTLTDTDRSFKRAFRLYLTYNLSASAVFLLRLGVLLLIERFTGLDVVVCNLIALCISGILNFSIYNLFVFKKNSRF